MKPKPDSVRVLAKQLFGASQRRKRKHGATIWGSGIHYGYRFQPSETVEVWDAVAREAIKRIKR